MVITTNTKIKRTAAMAIDTKCRIPKPKILGFVLLEDL